MKKTFHDVDQEMQDKAILVSLVTQKQKMTEEEAAYSLQELVNLADTAGVVVLETMTQNKEYADSKWFVGKGKAQELKARLQELKATTAIFDQELSGAQVRNLESFLDVKIIDRTQLILDIFAQRAQTREGIIQVELAQLNYLLPRLSGHGKNLSRLGGGIGTRGPGETKLETDRRHIRNRISELRRQLEDVVRHRNLHRERRKKTGAYQVALVGYTNAGKSTLLNKLTHADVYAENKLFATLDPTSRTLELPTGKQIVLTDTVGFIQNLPHEVVAAFRATLEEVLEADLILHVVDSSASMREVQMKVVDEVLGELGAQNKDQLVLFNKIDLCDAAEAEMLSAAGPSLKVSALREDDLDKIKLALQEHMMGGRKTFRVPAEKGDVISLLYRVGEVLGNEVDGEDMLFQVRIDNKDFEKYGYMLAPYDIAAATEKGETVQ